MKHTKLGWTAVLAVFALWVAAAPVAAKGGGGNPKVKPAVRVASAKPAAAPKAQAPKVKVQAAKTKAQTPKVKATGATKAKTTKATTSGPTLTSARREGQSPLSSANGSATKPTDTDPAPTARLNKAQQLLLKNDNLRTKVQTRLGGMDPIVAASGFRNLGQFVAAVNASYNNPGVSFRSLKALMTGERPMSLGQALQKLRGMDPATAATTANTAMAQADAEILANR